MSPNTYIQKTLKWPGQNCCIIDFTPSFRSNNPHGQRNNLAPQSMQWAIRNRDSGARAGGMLPFWNYFTVLIVPSYDLNTCLTRLFPRLWLCVSRGACCRRLLRYVH